jgi:hypothetical protein
MEFTAALGSRTLVSGETASWTPTEHGNLLARGIADQLVALRADDGGVRRALRQEPGRACAKTHRFTKRGIRETVGPPRA